MIDVAMLSRLQFAFTISFHILFPAFSIGLALFIFIMEAYWLKTKKIIYLHICKFWTKVFALTFGMGIVSGIVMEFQLGANFSEFTRTAGGVLGSLFTYEVMTAFFVEAGFLGVMLFGWNRVSHKLHFCATTLVVIGTTLSAYWIMCANSWMQHPVGYTLNDAGLFDVSSWQTILSNPFLPVRFTHMLLAAYISSGLVISSVSAYYLLKKQHLEFSKICFSFIWKVLPIIILLQLIVGDLNGEKVFTYQPLKTAAIEGIWDSGKGLPFLVFAWPDQARQKNFFEIKIPHGASLINTHQWNGSMIGLKTVTPADQPYVPIVFFSFRLMLGIGGILLLLCVAALYLRIKKQLFDQRYFLMACVLASPLGFLALWAGWLTAEVGRQPFVIYGYLRTADAASHISLYHVLVGFGLIILVYFIIFGFFYFYYLHQFLKKGPGDTQDIGFQPFAYMPPTGDEKK